MQSLIPIVVLGHNRTMMTIENIKCMMAYIKPIDGCSLHFIIGSDRSEDGHVQALTFFLKSAKCSFDILETSPDRCGLGNMMNMCFAKALEYSNVFIYTENDMLLHQQIDMQSYMKLLTDSKSHVGAINFKCSSSTKDKYAVQVLQYGDKKYLIPIPVSIDSCICNFGIGMFNRHFIQQLGQIDTGMDTDVSEKSTMKKYNSLFKNNAFPQSILVFDVDNYHEMMNDESGLFYHVGINCQHREGVTWNPKYIPSQYYYLSNEYLDTKFRRMFI